MKKIIFCTILFFVCVVTQSQVIAKWKITDFEKYVSTAKENVLVINFWATFCKPCVAEIPNFISTVKKHSADSVKLMLVSLDLKSEYPKKIMAFASKRKFKTNIAWLNETDADYFCPKVDAKWSGSIPSTLFINKQTGYHAFFEEELSAKEFEKQLFKAIAG